VIQELRRGPLRSDRRTLLESVTWPDGYRPAYPACSRATTGPRDKRARRGGELVVVATPSRVRLPRRRPHRLAAGRRRRHIGGHQRAVARHRNVMASISTSDDVKGSWPCDFSAHAVHPRSPCWPALLLARRPEAAALGHALGKARRDDCLSAHSFERW